MKGRVMDEVKRSFKPEFLNRIDEIIVFHPLNKSHMKNIVDIMLKDLITRSKEQMNLNLGVSEEAKEFLIEKGYDEKYGARPLRRTIQNEIEDALAEEILDGKIQEGNTIEVRKEGEKLQFLPVTPNNK